MTFNKALEKRKDQLDKDWVVKDETVDTSNPKTQMAVKNFLCDSLRDAGFVSLMMLVGTTWKVEK